MITILFALVSLLSFRVRSRASLELGLVTPRHQVTVLRRQRPGQLRLFSTDRLLWVWLYRVWPQVLNAMVLVKPATVLQWHRKGLSLRMIEEMLAARGIDVSNETIRRWALKFGQEFADRVRRRLPMAGDKWHLDEVVITIGGTKQWLWRAVDQNGVELDILIQSRRN